MRLDEFDFDLPDELIARVPAAQRDHSRLLLVDRKTGVRVHKAFFEIEHALTTGDVLVLNNTRVLPARLHGLDPKGRAVEIFLLNPKDNRRLSWKCLAKPGKRVSPHGEVMLGEGVTGHVSRTENGYEVTLENISAESFLPWLTRVGAPPLPPYLKRAATAEDVERYQTVYAKDPGSVAAPTAGLHLTQPLLERLRAKGVEIAELTLHVGYGTFAPIRVDNLSAHEMHCETFEIPADTFARLELAKREGRRVIAVGTTSLRALESIPTTGLAGETRIFIKPGFKFTWVDGLITNFHLPKSSLLVLVSAFLGTRYTKEAYCEAVKERYRFYSYGDAMAIL